MGDHPPACKIEKFATINSEFCLPRLSITISPLAFFFVKKYLKQSGETKEYLLNSNSFIIYLDVLLCT